MDKRSSTAILNPKPSTFCRTRGILGLGMENRREVGDILSPKPWLFEKLPPASPTRVARR